MSEYVPTTEEVRDNYTWGASACGCCAEYRDEDYEKFDRWLAEVRRQAAEEAWERCVGEMPIDPDWKNFYADNNPYKKAEE